MRHFALSRLAAPLLFFLFLATACAAAPAPQTHDTPQVGPAGVTAIGAAVGTADTPPVTERQWPASQATTEGRASIAARPNDPAGYLQVGQAALAAGDAAAAVKVLEDGRAITKPSAPLLVLLGAGYLAQARFADAEAATQEALALDAACAGGQVQLGKIYSRIGWPETALECYEKALAQTPGDPQAQSALVYGLIDAGRAAQAESECRRFLGEPMQNTVLLVALGESLEAQAQLRPAFNAYGRALVIDAGCAPAHARRGRLYCRFGQFDAAATECRAGLASDPRDALAHAYLGIAYAYQGQTEAAREHVLQAEAAGLRMDAVWGKLAQ